MLAHQKTDSTYMLKHRGNFTLHVLCKQVHLFIQWIHSSSEALFILKERSRKIWIGWQPALHLQSCQSWLKQHPGAQMFTLRRAFKPKWKYWFWRQQPDMWAMESHLQRQNDQCFAKGQSWAGNGPQTSGSPEDSHFICLIDQHGGFYVRWF